MASLRTALGRVVASENDGPQGKLVGKAALAGVGGLKSRPVRGAMQEIGNNAAAITKLDKGIKTGTSWFLSLVDENLLAV